MSVLNTKGLAASVGTAQLLASTDITFETGTLTAIVGPNGAGKSTLLKALLGLISHQGNVDIDATDRAALAPKERAKQLAYLPQGQAQAWPLPVRDVVALGRYPYGSKDADDVVDALIAQMDLGALAARAVTTLSGGEQMRVALARALAVEASFLLADEPLASLDPHHQFAIMDLLHAQAQAGAGVVIVIHDLRLAARYASRIVLMHEGHVLADGSVETVLTPALLAQGFGVESRMESLDSADGALLSVALPSGPSRLGRLGR